MSALLNKILAPGGLTPRFQPIMATDGPEPVLYGVECLLRGPRDTNVEAADVLFDYVQRKRAEQIVDRACIALALQEGRRIPAIPHVSLNLYASTVARDIGLASFLSQAAQANQLDLRRVTLEIIEHGPLWDSPAFLAGLRNLRELGVRIALDDIGLGHSNFKMMIDCCPDLFKIDRYIIQGIDQDHYRQAVVRSVVTLANDFGAKVCAEGVERGEELAMVKALGISLVQGYLFGPAMSVEKLVQTYFPSETETLATLAKEDPSCRNLNLTDKRPLYA